MGQSTHGELVLFTAYNSEGMHLKNYLTETYGYQEGEQSPSLPYLLWPPLIRLLTPKVSIYCIFVSGATEGARAKKLNEITPVFDEFTQQGKLSACYCFQQ